MSNFVDALGAAGGISALFISLTYTLNELFAYNKHDNFLASHLYKDSDTDKPLNQRSTWSIKDWLIDEAPFTCCLRLRCCQ